MTLRRIGVGSAARVAGVMYAILGVIAGLLVAFVSVISSGFVAAQSPDMPPWLGAVFGVGAIVIFPVLYGVMGLIFGAVTAAVYNAVASTVGGIDLELHDSGPALSSSAR